MPKAAAKTSAPRLPAEIFSADFNPSLIHQALTSYLSNERQGSVLLKNRSAVRGGGKKPFRQKGTGRARAGTIRSPIWVGGGATFANVKNYEKKINKKMAKKLYLQSCQNLNLRKDCSLLKMFHLRSQKPS